MNKTMLLNGMEKIKGRT